jgi:hypothetical protein
MTDDDLDSLWAQRQAQKHIDKMFDALEERLTERIVSIVEAAIKSHLEDEHDKKPLHPDLEKRAKKVLL